MDKSDSLPRELAVRNVLNRGAITPVVETVELRDALWRIAAEDIRSSELLPKALASRFDGIAVRYDALSCHLRNNTYQDSFELSIRDIAIAETGRPLPEGFDTVICSENVLLYDERIIEVRGPISRQQNTILPGTVQQKGEILVRAGEEISPLTQAKLASSSQKVVSVYSKPIFSIISCGESLVPLGNISNADEVIESNSFLIAGKALTWGAQAGQIRIAHNKRSLRGIFKECLAQSDFVILNAGASIGRGDFAMEVIDEVGTILNHTVGSAPGRRASYSLAQGKVVIGLSGLLQSAEHTVDWYVKPIVMAFLGRNCLRRQFYAILDENVCTTKKLPFTLRAFAYIDEKTREFRVRPLSTPQDVIQKATDNCNCFLTISQYDNILPKDSIVEVELREGAEII